MDHRQNKGKFVPEKKYRYVNEEGHQLTGGGVFIYDNEGIWAVGEQMKRSIVFTDIGGKYVYQDGDIYQTIAREFNEETYHCDEVSRRKIIDLIETGKGQVLSLSNNQNRPVYISVAIHISDLDIQIDPKLFLSCRESILKSNPDVPVGLYKSVELRHFKFSEIEQLIRQNTFSSRFVTLFKLFKSSKVG